MWSVSHQAIQLGALNNADVMLVSGLSQAPSLNPDTMIGQICEGVGMFTVHNLAVIQIEGLVACI